MRSVTQATMRQLARLQYRIGWDFRLVNSANQVYTIPTHAILDRHRSGEVDGSTWTMTLQLLQDKLPNGGIPGHYERIEADLLIPGEAPIPYFRGLIDKPRYSEELVNGAVERILSLDCFGMLQKAKGYFFPSLRVDPANVYAFTRLMGICTVQRYAPNIAAGAGSDEYLPDGAPVYGGNEGGIRVHVDGSMAVQYTMGVDFTIDLTTSPIKIHWINAPAITRVIEWPKVERFVLPIWFATSTYTAPAFFGCPYGRRYDDLYHTYITAIDAPNKRVTVADPTGWADKLDTLTGEYVAFTPAADGLDYIRKVNTFLTASNEIEIVGTESLPANLAVGDPVRLATTEFMQAWDEKTIVLYYTSAAPVTEWNRSYFVTVKNQGQAIPVGGNKRNWTTAESVYASLAYIYSQNYDPNRVEQLIKYLLTTHTGLFSASEVTAEKTGAYIKNYSIAAKDFSEVLSEMKTQALPPSSHIHDNPDGTISIKPYQQKVTPDWEMRGVDLIEDTDLPEPITSVTIVGTGEPSNVAPQMYLIASGFTNPERMIDNAKGVSATQTATGTPALITFRIPRPTPVTAYPLIDKIKVTGTGLLTAYVTRNGSTYYLGTCNFRPIDSGSLEISTDELNSLLTSGTTTEYQDLTLRFDDITTGDTLPGTATAATCSEVEIITTKPGAWRAMLIDDPGAVVKLDGTNDYVNIPHQSALNAYPLTIEALVKTTTVGSPMIVSKEVAGSSNGYRLGFVSGNLVAHYEKSAGNVVDMSAGANVTGVNDGAWHHVAFTVDASGGLLYVDGILRKSTAWTGVAGSTTTTADLRIGEFNATYLAGSVAEVRIWNKNPVIPSYYIAGRRHKPLNGNESGLIGYWRMNDGSGTTATDYSTSGYHGTLTNGAAWDIPGDRPTPWAPADQGTSEFGTIWRQCNSVFRESYRFAPTAILKQWSPKYRHLGNQEARNIPKSLKGISQQKCRDYSERYQDEYLRNGKTYKVRAMLDPRAELGDTVRVWRTDGTHLDLLLWNMSDQGPPDALDVDYVLIDYSK